MAFDDPCQELVGSEILVRAQVKPHVTAQAHHILAQVCENDISAFPQRLGFLGEDNRPGQDHTLQSLFQKLRSLGKENHALFLACRFPEDPGMLAAQPPAKAEYTPALYSP